MNQRLNLSFRLLCVALSLTVFAGAACTPADRSVPKEAGPFDRHQIVEYPARSDSGRCYQYGAWHLPGEQWSFWCNTCECRPNGIIMCTLKACDGPPPPGMD